MIPLHKHLCYFCPKCSAQEGRITHIGSRNLLYSLNRIQERELAGFSSMFVPTDSISIGYLL